MNSIPKPSSKLSFI